ncbi:MAG: NADH-quinone oxidoreductase subunit NuoK [Deltaproteobacteria bacterium]
MLGAPHFAIVAALLFGLGLCGVVVRRNALVVFMSVELMLNAANLTFLTFARMPLRGRPDLDGHAIAFFVIAVAAAEASVGLAVVIAAFRSRGSINVDDLNTLRS